MWNYNAEMLLTMLDELSKKLEIYYKKLYIENELSFILDGRYYIEEELTNILQGNY